MGSDLSQTRTFQHVTRNLTDSGKLTRNLIEGEADGKTWVVILKVADTPHTVELHVKGETTFGRELHGGGNNKGKHIDLTKFQAEEQGVSRVHAALRVQANHLVVSDLGSTNGTFLNGYKVPRQANLPVRERDTIELGKFRLQVVFSSQAPQGF